MKIVLLFFRLFLGAIFIYAGVEKALNPSEFAHNIDNYRLLPYLLVTISAVILPWVEIIAGLLLIFGRFLLSSSFIIMLLNLVFIVAIATAMARGLDIECGCFSIKGSTSKVGVVRLIEDAIFFLMAAAIFWSARKEKIGTTL